MWSRNPVGRIGNPVSGMPRHRLPIVGISWSCETPMKELIDRQDPAIGAGFSGSALRCRKAEVTGVPLLGWSRAACAAPGSSYPTIMPACAPRGVSCSARPRPSPGRALAALPVPPRCQRRSPRRMPASKNASAPKARNVWTAATLAEAEAALDERVAACRDPASAPATWLENVVPDGFHLPEHRRRHPHTSNPSSAPSSRDPSVGPPRSASCQLSAAPAARLRRSRRD